MTLSELQADSYGSLAGVIALARIWTKDGDFIDPDEVYEIVGTNPTESTVIDWLNDYSDLLNMTLAKYGFVVPLQTDRGKASAGTFINQIVSDLCDKANSSGRFVSEGFKDTGESFLTVISKDMDDWVRRFAIGLETGGETRKSSGVFKISTRDHDAEGEATFPIYQRKGFGIRLTNWTKP